MIKDVEGGLLEQSAQLRRCEARERLAQHVRLRLARNAGEQYPILHDGEQPRLLVDGARRLDGRLDQLGQHRLRNRIIGVFAHRAAGVEGLLEFHDVPRCAPIRPKSSALSG